MAVKWTLTKVAGFYIVYNHVWIFIVCIRASVLLRHKLLYCFQSRLICIVLLRLYMKQAFRISVADILYCMYLYLYFCISAVFVTFTKEAVYRMSGILSIAVIWMVGNTIVNCKIFYTFTPHFFCYCYNYTSWDITDFAFKTDSLHLFTEKSSIKDLLVIL